MGRLDPTVEVCCDVCEDLCDTFSMTALAGRCWDERGLESQLKGAGWEWNEDEDQYICPNCIEDRDR